MVQMSSMIGQILTTLNDVKKKSDERDVITSQQQVQLRELQKIVFDQKQKQEQIQQQQQQKHVEEMQSKTRKRLSYDETEVPAKKVKTDPPHRIVSSLFKTKGYIELDPSEVRVVVNALEKYR